MGEKKQPTILNFFGNTSRKSELVEESIGPSQIPSSSSTSREEDKTEGREKKKFKVLR